MLLSEREQAFLLWTSRGKSSWEIGRILSISRNTITFHLKPAMRKLASNSRTFTAIQIGLIEAAIEEAS